MKVVCSSAIVGTAAAAAAVVLLDRGGVAAFVPAITRRHRAVATTTAGPPTTAGFACASPLCKRPSSGPARKSTSLQMASEDFNESKYTEAAWASIASITKAADFYETSQVEAPLLLEVMLNPVKHGAGEDAEAAKRVVEKVLSKAGVNIKDLRSALEKYLSKQPRVTGGGTVTQQRSMGRSFAKVLDTARQEKGVLGVSTSFEILTF